MTVKKGKSYTVKEWFANKVAEEVKQNITDCDVFAVIKETEKAVYAMLYIGFERKKTMWIPKSVLVEREIGEDAIGLYNHETLIVGSYEEASEEFSFFCSSYK